MYVYLEIDTEPASTIHILSVLFHLRGGLTTSRQSTGTLLADEHTVIVVLNLI